MIHIVGLYKCGTSWLLQMLAAHPQVIAWREFDPLRTVFPLDHRPRRLPQLARDYLRRQPQHEAWITALESSYPCPAEQRFRDFFLGRGWLPLMGEDLQIQAAQLATDDLDPLIDQLLRMGDLRLRDKRAPSLDSQSLQRPLGVQSIRRSDLKTLMTQVHRDGDATDSVLAFFAMLQAQIEPPTTLVTKAADQVMQLRHLQRLSPRSTCLAIVRDGRDAAISAQHYEALMRKRDAPWRVARRGARRRALAWSVRAAKLAGHAERGEVTVCCATKTCDGILPAPAACSCNTCSYLATIRLLSRFAPPRIFALPAEAARREKVRNISYGGGRYRNGARPWRPAKPSEPGAGWARNSRLSVTAGTAHSRLQTGCSHRADYFGQQWMKPDRP